MAMTQKKRKPLRRGGRPARRELLAPGIPYTMKLPDGRTVFVEVPGRMAARDRSGQLAFTPEGVRFLDHVRALGREPATKPSSAFLAALREALGLTQAQLGARLGRDKLTVSRWECGTVRPNAEALKKLYTLARQRKEAGVVLVG
jgi:DNA-binding XRE family transcriptional regulator